MSDLMVRATQIWLNRRYGNDPRFNVIPETEYGKTGWVTIYALTRALQIELGIQNTSNNFGPTTQALFSPISRQDNVQSNLFGIVQGALWCKGYSTGHYGVMEDGEYVIQPVFDVLVENAVKSLESDAGRSIQTGIVDLNLMKALLSMDYFVCSSLYGGDTNMQLMQQYLNCNYENYIGLRPCDGVYGRSTNTALIYAIQAEEGMSTSVANGNFGPSTKSHCPTIPYSNVEENISGSKYTVNQINRFNKLLQIALYANGFGSGTLSDTFNQTDVMNFQQAYNLPQNGVCSLGIWLALLTSCGDINRSATACDCATILTQEKAATLYSNGYRWVGRYLSGTAAGGVSKALTIEELNIAFNAGLFIFLIQQRSANTVSYFTEANAEIDVADAVQHAVALGIPSGTTIYFAVDCDPQEGQITNYIIPYFRKINNVMRNQYNNKYVIGVYGTRNVCTKVSNNNYAQYSFVSDMSTGFSGNLGFKIPDNWAFDQFTTTTVGTGSGQIEIDKDAYSGRDIGLVSNLFLTDVGKVYYSLLDMYNLAMEYTNNDQSESNRLVLQYIRKGTYGDTTIIGSSGGGSGSNFQWQFVAGTIDEDYCDLVDEKLTGLSFNFIDSLTNKQHDLAHWAATLNAILYPLLDGQFAGFDQVIDIDAGWGGDTISFAKDIKNYASNDYQAWANANICTDQSAHFGLVDYIDDIDAVNIGNIINQYNLSLPEAFHAYYILKDVTNVLECDTRSTRFMNSMGTTAFNQLCYNINIDDFPTNVLKALLAGSSTEQYYIDAAILAFKNFVNNEVLNGR